MKDLRTNQIFLGSVPVQRRRQMPSPRLPKAALGRASKKDAWLRARRASTKLVAFLVCAPTSRIAMRNLCSTSIAWDISPPSSDDPVVAKGLRTPWIGDVPNTSPTFMSCRGLDGGVISDIRLTISILMAPGLRGVAVGDSASELEVEDDIQ